MIPNGKPDENDENDENDPTHIVTLRPLLFEAEILSRHFRVLTGLADIDLL